MTIYEQIIELRNLNLDKPKRGYLFEQLIRELMPWDKKPPIVISPKSEQLDGVFTYNSIPFLIESKAVNKIIKPGDYEWKNYEAKLNKRNGNVVGLYCSLFEVSSDLISEADDLNKRGYINIILHGNIWEQLFKDSFDFRVLLDFMHLNARYKSKASIQNLRDVKKWHFNTTHINDFFVKLSFKFSATLIRRFEHDKHSQIFVERSITKSLESHINLFRPSSLKNKFKQLQTGTYSQLPQIILLRDVSGSGKTTLAIDYLVKANFAFCFGLSATQEPIDDFFDKMLGQIEYVKFGIKELEAVDKPLLFIIDSLDETFKKDQPQKRREINSVIKAIEGVDGFHERLRARGKPLNEVAKEEGFIKFPIVILITLRDDYWKDWEELFDGREILFQKDKISLFTDIEFDKALLKYSIAYRYNITNSLNNKTKAILSSPINLDIFSQVHANKGDINIYDVWEGEILMEFFRRKYENILSKHYIEKFDEEVFLKLLSTLSYRIISSKNVLFDISKIKEILRKEFSYLEGDISNIIKLLRSEQIFIEDPRNNNLLRFTYTRFVEYLMALHIILEVNQKNELTILNGFIQEIYESDVIDTFAVLKNIRSICHTNYKEIGGKISDYYQNSDIYLEKYLPRLRYDISRGKLIGKDEIKKVIGKTFSENPQINWDIFFILSAKKNKQTNEKILAAFKAAWETALGVDADVPNKYIRWKLIDKLSSSTNLLISETVLHILFNDSIPKDWEVYLGRVLEKITDERDEFFELWQQIGGQQILLKQMEKTPKEWEYVIRLLEIILENKKYVIGDILTLIEIEEREYITFDKSKNYKIDKEKRAEVDKYIDFLISRIKLTDSGFSNNLIAPRLLKTEEIVYLNDQFDEKITKHIMLESQALQNKQAFFNYLITNYHSYENLIKEIMFNKLINIPIEINTSSNNESLLQSLVSTKIDTIKLPVILEYIYSKGYCKNKHDDEYFKNESCDEYESFYLIKSYYLVNNRELGRKIFEIEKIIFTLYSIIHNRVIGFRFPNFIQVANNALNSYRDHAELILHTMQLYGIYNELIEKKSFKKLVDNFDNREQNEGYNDILKKIFPNLF